MGSPGRGVAGAKNDLKNSLDKLGEFYLCGRSITFKNNNTDGC